MKHLAMSLPILLALACGVEGLLKRGEQAIAREDLVAAEVAFRKALAREPDSLEALYGLGWTYHLAERPEQAREAFERCLRQDPQSHLGHKGLGSTDMALGNLAAARRHFEEALARAPGDFAVRNSLALWHLKAGELEEALAAFRQLRLLEPDNLQPVQGEAEALLGLDRAQEAVRILDEALATPAASSLQLAPLHLLRARALVGVTAERLDPQDCEGTGPPLLAWLDEADAALDRAEAVGGVLPDLPAARRLVSRRRKAVLHVCDGISHGHSADGARK